MIAAQLGIHLLACMLICVTLSSQTLCSKGRSCLWYHEFAKVVDFFFYF